LELGLTNLRKTAKEPQISVEGSVNNAESASSIQNDQEEPVDSRISMDNDESDNEEGILEQTDSSLASGSNSISGSSISKKDAARPKASTPKTQSMNSLKKIAKTKINTSTSSVNASGNANANNPKKSTQTGDLKPKKF